MPSINQYSRIAHHTITGSASATFSIPGTSDFTIPGAWTPKDLYLSEIGVQEATKKVYIRINDTIEEFMLVGMTGIGAAGATGPTGPAGGAQDLASTLSYGDFTGGNDITISTGDGIYSSDGLASIKMDNAGLGSINLTQNNGTSSTTFDLTGTYINSVASLGLTASGISISKDMIDIYSEGAPGEQFSYIEVADTSLISSTTNGATAFANLELNLDDALLIAGDIGAGNYGYVRALKESVSIGQVESSTEKSAIEVGHDINGNYRVSNNRTNFAWGSGLTIGFATASVFSLSVPATASFIWLKAQVKGLNTGTYSKGYVADIFAGFRNDGSLNLIGNGGSGYYVNEWTDFTGGTKATLDIVGTDIIIRVLGETSSNINWETNVSWG